MSKSHPNSTLVIFAHVLDRSVIPPQKGMYLKTASTSSRTIPGSSTTDSPFTSNSHFFSGFRQSKGQEKFSVKVQIGKKSIGTKSDLKSYSYVIRFVLFFLTLERRSMNGVSLPFPTTATFLFSGQTSTTMRLLRRCFGT